MAHTLAEFAQSIFASYKVPECENPLGLPENTLGRHCILLVDGLGRNAVDEYCEGLSFSKFDYQRTMQATFPSTTATSLTSFGTGSSPGQHGMVGYTMLVPHSGSPERVLNALKWDERIDPAIWQPIPTLFERGSAAGISVTHIAGKRYANTGFTRAALRGANYVGANTIEEMATAAGQALSRPGSFTYLYLNDVDEASHAFGYGSERFQLALRKVDELVLKLAAELPKGTNLWITSDHGMINVGESIVIGKDNDLLSGIRVMAGEPRVRYLHLTDPDSTETEELWRDFLGAKVNIYRRQEAIDAGLFGTSVTARNAERIGDLVVIANERLILVELEREVQQLSMVGHHGGVTPAEIEIPLLMGEI